MSKLIMITIIPEMFLRIIFQTIIISKYQIDNFLTKSFKRLEVLAADWITQ